MSSTSLPSSSSSPSSIARPSNRLNHKIRGFIDSGRTKFSPIKSSYAINSVNNSQSGSNAVALHNLLKLNQLVDTLKSLKHLISHYFEQISKQGESVLAGDVRRVYRRILLMYVKYRRRQNYEKQRIKQSTDESDGDDDNNDNNTDNSNTNNHNNDTSNANISQTWSMKKGVSSQSLPFTRAGFDGDPDDIEDFDDIAFAAIRDVANIQNHCIRSILNDHRMKLPIYDIKTRWDSEAPKQKKQFESTIMSTINNQVEFVKKTEMKFQNIVPLASSHSSSLPISMQMTTDQELFLGSFARQLNEQTWQQLHSILANLNSQTSPSSKNPQEQLTK